MAQSSPINPNHTIQANQAKYQRRSNTRPAPLTCLFPNTFVNRGKSPVPGASFSRPAESVAEHDSVWDTQSSRWARKSVGRGYGNVESRGGRVVRRAMVGGWDGAVERGAWGVGVVDERAGSGWGRSWEVSREMVSALMVCVCCCCCPEILSGWWLSRVWVEVKGQCQTRRRIQRDQKESVPRLYPAQLMQVCKHRTASTCL